MHSISWTIRAGKTALSVLALTFVSGCTLLVSQPQRPQPAAAPPTLDFADPVLNQRTITLFGELTSEKAETVIRQLYYLSGKSSESISIHVGTTGGDISAGIAIANAMRVTSARVSVMVPSGCDASGTIVLVAATGDRLIFPESTVSIRGMGSPNSKEEGEPSAYAEFWKRNAKLPADWDVTDDRFLRLLSADQALEYGLVDQVAEVR